MSSRKRQVVSQVVSEIFDTEKSLFSITLIFTIFDITQKNRIQFSLKSLKIQIKSSTIDLQNLNQIVRADFELFTPKNEPFFSLFRKNFKN